MLLVTYKDGHTELVETPFKASKEEMALIEKVEQNPKESYRKTIENEMQSFVHSMNHLSRNAVESPFTNVSIFDRPKLKSLLADDNLGWYYSLEPADELATVPQKAMDEANKLYDANVSEEHHEEWIDYVTDIILELEDIFMDVMDRGDVAHNNRPITFPVTTCNISRGKDENGNYKFEDPDFVDHICKNHDIMRYNIYISEGNKVASCCHDFNNSLYYKKLDDGTWHLEPIGQFVKSHLEKGKTENPIEASKYQVYDPNGNLIDVTGVMQLKNDSKELIEMEFEDGQVLKVTPNHMFEVKDSEGVEKLVTASEIMKNPEDYDF